MRFWLCIIIWVCVWYGYEFGGCDGGVVVAVGWKEGEEEDREIEKKRGCGFGGLKRNGRRDRT